MPSPSLQQLSPPDVVSVGKSLIYLSAPHPAYMKLYLRVVLDPCVFERAYAIQVRITMMLSKIFLDHTL